MNTAARALAQNNFSQANDYSLTFSRQIAGVLLLVIAVLTSAFSVVYVKSLDRQLFNQLQTLYQKRDSLNVEKGKLLLEQNTFAAPARVQSIAQDQLGMVIPKAKEINIISTQNEMSKNNDD
jgi:cell division protein FtsL